MNTPIARLFAVSVVLFAVLVAFTSSWTVFGADDLQKNPKNRRELLEAQKIRRGTIRAADGTVLARSVRRSDGTSTPAATRRTTSSPTRSATRTPASAAPVSSAYDDDLTGRRDAPGTVFERLVGSDRRGDDVTTTLDPAAQRVAVQQLAGRTGSVVALDPRTGAVKVMATSRPTTPTPSATPPASKP